MTVPLLDPTKLRRQRQIMGLLLGLVLLMALIAGAALWLAVRQAQQLAQPNPVSYTHLTLPTNSLV